MQVPGISVVKDAATYECDAEFDGEAVHMVWHVTIAKCSPSGD